MTLLENQTKATKTWDVAQLPSGCLVSVRSWIQIPVPPQNKTKQNKPACVLSVGTQFTWFFTAYYSLFSSLYNDAGCFFGSSFLWEGSCAM
jgi:hypothetical protein